MFTTGIHHAAIVVSDIERSLRFYRDTLGWGVFHDMTLNKPNVAELLGLPEVDGRAILLQKDRETPIGMIELLEIKISQRELECRKVLDGFHLLGLRLLSFRVKDAEEMYESLVKKGVKFLSPPKRIHLGEYAIKACILLDPDGVYIEVIEFLR